MGEIQRRPELDMVTVVAGSMVLKRFGRPVDRVVDDGFSIDSEVYLELEGGLPVTMAKSVGFGIVEFASEFQRLAPDIVLLIGDRYEALAAAVAAAYMNLCIVHLQGGEVSGSIDESARHAITKLAHYHYPSTHKAAENLIRMGERPDTILGVGCPSGDLAVAVNRKAPAASIHGQGSGVEIDFARPFLLVVFHPTTTEFGSAADEVLELLKALGELELQTVLLWPNIDAGSDEVSKAIRVFRTTHPADWLRTIINLSPEEYLQTLATAACAVGNSSSFVRDGGFLGTPVVLIGRRQQGRECDEHVLPVEARADAIKEGIRVQLGHGRYPASRLYGDGQVAPEVAEALCGLTPYCQKRLQF